ncbi:MAG: glycosyltransferase family 39 protein [Chloroflexota bacterium]
MRLSSTKFIMLAAAILLVGFAIRLAVHDFFGLDGDDITSLIISRNDPATIINGLLALRLDIHPPLHYLVLKGWTTLAGDSLLSLHLMNILIDLLTGAVVMRCAVRLYGREGGLIAGVLWIVAPLLIFSGYLIRMYTLLTLFVTLGAYCAVLAISGDRRRMWWAGSAAMCGLAAVYTHSLGVIAFVGLGVVVILGNLRRWKVVLAGLLWFVLAAFLTLPYLGPVWAYYRSGSKLGAQFSFYNFSDPLDIPGTLIAVLVAHRLITERLLILAMVPLAVLLSVLLWRRFGKRLMPVLFLFWIWVGAMSVLAWAAHIYKTFYLTAFAPLAIILLAGSLLMIPRRTIRTLLLVILVTLLGAGTLRDLDHSVRDDPVAAAQFIEQHERPGDMVLVAPDWAAELFKYHYHGNARVVGVFQGVTRGVDLDTILPFVTKDATGVWIVRFQVPATDPDNLLDEWFSTHAVFGTKVYPMNIPVSYYDLMPQKTVLPADAHPLDARFGDVVALRGVVLPVQQGSAHNTRLHPPSNWVQVTLYWESLKPGANFVPRVRFTDGNGQVFGGELNDNPTARLLSRDPVTSWQKGQIWESISTLNLNPDTPPGLYNIEVTVLDPATGQPLPTSGADAGTTWVIAGHYTIQ